MADLPYAIEGSLLRRKLAPWILTLGLAGCSPIDVAVDYDPRVDFSKIRTWAWFPEPSTTSPPDHAPEEVDPLTLQRSREAIAGVLSGKGFVMAKPEEADVLIAVHSAVERHVRYGPSYGWGGAGAGVRGIRGDLTGTAIGAPPRFTSTTRPRSSWMSSNRSRPGG